MPSEIELKFAIIHRHPEKVLHEIAALKQIGGYTLIPEDDLQISDIYFDTTDKLLQRNKFALRHRTQNQNRFITLKGKSKIQSYGAVHRLEIDRVWSEKSLESIAQTLAEEIADFNRGEIIFSSDSPLSTLKTLGLNPIHQRNTFRQVRQISEQYPDSPIAELVLDKTFYVISKKKLSHFELEVELKGKGTEKELENIKSNLISIFPDALHLWTISKLEMGMILEKLIDNPEFRYFIKAKSQITPQGYRLIKEYSNQFRQQN